MRNRELENNRPEYTAYHENDTASENEYVSPQNNKKSGTRADRRLKKAGKLFIITAVLSLIIGMQFNSGSSVKESEEVNNAIKQQTSKELALGARLFAKDENMAAQDYTITHQSTAEKSKIWIWDYAAEDGDYVQVLVDSVPIGDAFMIKNKPVQIEVPATGVVQVLGVRDGGGGITYAINYEINGVSYFNGTDVSSSNTYTLVRE